jgi:hypothetical protein
MNAVVFPATFGRDARAMSPFAGSGGTLRCAWLVEVACIGIGLLLALSASVEAGGILHGVIAAAPFAAAAVVETARIPLVQMFFNVRGLVWRGLAVVMILLAGVLTAENLVFGFERAFSVRIEEVRRAAQHAADSATLVSDLAGQADALRERRAAAERQVAELAREEEAARARAEADVSASGEASSQTRQDARAQLEAAQREQAAAQARHAREQAAMMATCRAAPERCAMGGLNRRHQQETSALAERVSGLGQAVIARGATADQERLSALARRDAALSDIRARKEPLEADLRVMREEAAALAASLARAHRDAATAAADAEALRRQSQMHRLAQSVLGNQDDNAAMLVLGWFSVVSAVVLAAAGSVLAALHFRHVTQPAADAGASSSRLARALRGWLARRRRRHSLVRTVEVEKVVEKPVEKFVDRVVEVTKPELVLVPVPLEATEEERRRILSRAAGSQAKEG